MSPLTVSQRELHSLQLPSAVTDSRSMNTPLLKVILSSHTEWGFICGLTDLSWQIIFNTFWASITVGLKCPIAWQNSRHEHSWCFYLQCGIAETSIPGIVCIVCYHVLPHPSAHGTSSMGKHLLAKVHFAKVKELTESEVSELTSIAVDKTPLAIFQRQGSRGIRIVRLQKKFKFDCLVFLILTWLIDRML
jgi:hypothetical protein